MKKPDAKKAAKDATPETEAPSAPEDKAPKTRKGAREVTSAPTSSSTAEERVAIAAKAGIQLPPALESGGDLGIKDILKKAADDTGKTEKALREAFKGPFRITRIRSLRQGSWRKLAPCL